MPTTRRGKVGVSAFVNGFTGERGATDRAKLTELTRTWRKRGLRDLVVRLSTGSRLFHAKALVFESVKGVTVLVGLGERDGGRVHEQRGDYADAPLAQGPRRVRQYLDAVSDNSVDFDDVVPGVANNLPAFFRGGDADYRPAVTATFRFDLRLPAPLRTVMARLQGEQYPWDSCPGRWSLRSVRTGGTERRRGA